MAHPRSASPYFFRRYPRLSMGIVVLVLLGMIDFVAGAILIPRERNWFRVQHPYYHHGLRPSVETRGYWGEMQYPFSTNSLGFRDSSQRKVPLQGSRHRILLLGDSHTEAVGVDWSQSFAGEITSESATRGVEVLNAAAVSYSPKIEYLKAKYLIERMKLAVNEIWLFVDISDLQNELVYQKYTPSEHLFWSSLRVHCRDFFYRHSFFYYYVARIRRLKETSVFLEKSQMIQDYYAGRGDFDSYAMYASFFSDFDDQVLLAQPGFHSMGDWYYDSSYVALADSGIALAQSNVLRLKELCQRHRIGLTVCVHPWQAQIMRRQPEDRYTRKWASFCNIQQIRFVNLFPVFINDSVPMAEALDCYIPGDNHWNPRGHSRVARCLKNLLPE